MHVKKYQAFRVEKEQCWMEGTEGESKGGGRRDGTNYWIVTWESLSSPQGFSGDGGGRGSKEERHCVKGGRAPEYNAKQKHIRVEIE